MNVFSFDEDSLCSDFDTVIKDYLDPFETGDDVQTGSDEVQPFYNDNTLKIPDGRRKSSVYRRMSVKISTSAKSFKLELTIPLNFNTDFDSTKTENGTKKRERKLCDFIPLKVLGQGAYGKVHLVQDKYSSRLFAQKQLKKPTINLIKDEVDTHSIHVQRTISERQILTNITHHPNIVKLFYALQDNNKFYLILEYIPGGELFHHLASPNNTLGNVFLEDDVAFYAAEMALGLKHLHDLGIVYRDLKPENCLLNSSGHLVLTDFGLSKSIRNDDNCRSIIGTPEYMAPEILKGEEYDYSVDWWSLGCVIYDMMVGKPPFTGNSHAAIQKKILKNKVQFPHYFSLDAKDLLNKLLQKSPSKRFSVTDNWEKFKNHRFFRKIDWKKLETQDSSYKPPIVPTITDPILAENFDELFTRLNISDYNANESKDPTFRDNLDFKGFSYTASNSFIDRFCT